MNGKWNILRMSKSTLSITRFFKGLLFWRVCCIYSTLIFHCCCKKKNNQSCRSTIIRYIAPANAEFIITLKEYDNQNLWNITTTWIIWHFCVKFIRLTQTNVWKQVIQVNKPYLSRELGITIHLNYNRITWQQWSIFSQTYDRRMVNHVTMELILWDLRYLALGK